MGFKDAETYIQSGNVVFGNSGNLSEKEKILKHLKETEFQ